MGWKKWVAIAVIVFLVYLFLAGISEKEIYYAVISIVGLILIGVAIIITFLVYGNEPDRVG